MTFGIIFVSHSSTQPTSGICKTTEYTIIAEYCTVEYARLVSLPSIVKGN